MTEIDIREIKGFRIGQAEDKDAATGCTVVLCGNGAAAGLDVRGGGPASRESQLLSPLANAEFIHAVVLAGGSAFGLDAAGGVQKYLEERGIGYDVGVAKVPLVCQADLFDLTVGRPDIRPDAAMAYKACEGAYQDGSDGKPGNYRDGCFGAGTGATVGKICGMERCTKTGMGSYAVRAGELEVGAIVALNALGDVFDWKSGRQIAGLVSEDGKGFSDSSSQLVKYLTPQDNKFTSNTTLAVILTNADLPKARLCKVAGMAQDGMARAIRPVHTSADGDSVFALGTGEVKADTDLVGCLAADVLSEAIKRAVMAAESGYGIRSAARIHSDRHQHTGV